MKHEHGRVLSMKGKQHYASELLHWRNAPHVNLRGLEIHDLNGVNSQRGKGRPDTV